MKKLQPLAAVCLSLVLAFALVPFGGTQALADEPLSEQNEGESGVTLEIDWVTPLSTNKIEIAFSITNNTDVSLPSTNMVGFYKRSITKSNFIIYRYIRIEVKPGTTVQRVDTVEAIGIGSVPLVLHLFDNGTTYPKVTPANLPIGDAAGHEATQSVNPAETVALSSFSVERVNSSAVTVTYTVTNTTPYEVSSGSFISFYKDSVDKENFLLKKTLPKAVPPGTSVTMTQTLSKTG
ncbi:MAG: hypothetical protein LBH56_04700, partial [Coriobacteriales bacterium]|nr:hypothetical protein [Coriobacteriales bacterium]